MDCPQCGSGLVTYALSGREASVCERCGFVGIEADHAGDGDLLAVESWDDALRRYHEDVPALGSDAGARVPLGARPSPDPAVDESWDEALARFAGGEDDGTGSDRGGTASEAAPDADEERAGTAESGADVDGTVGSADGPADADEAAPEAGADEADPDPDADDADEAAPEDEAEGGVEGTPDAPADRGGE
jgi:hypothetical protein